MSDAELIRALRCELQQQHMCARTAPIDGETLTCSVCELLMAARERELTLELEAISGPPVDA